MHSKETCHRLVSLVCMGLTMALALIILLGAFPQKPERYSSIHEGAGVPPLFGLSADSLVNTGDTKALDQLPGVGEVISQRIIETREAIGGFRLPEDLTLVKGIGEKTLAKIMDALDEPLVRLPEIDR